MDKERVYHSVSLLLGEIDDRLHHSQTGDLSARYRYTTVQYKQVDNALREAAIRAVNQAWDIFATTDSGQDTNNELSSISRHWYPDSQVEETALAA
jgi:hypothetical protein